MKGKDAIPVLQAAGLNRKLARETLDALNGVRWSLRPLEAKGNPIAVFPPKGVETYKNNNGGGNRPQ